MAFYTPRGLKIRLPVKYGFTLLARLYPERSPETVLTTAESLESLPAVNAQLLALILVWYGAPLWAVVTFGLLGAIGGTLILWYGFFVVPGEISLAAAWSRIPMFVRLPGILGLAFWLQGWQGLGAFVLAYLAAGGAGWALDYRMTKLRFHQTGLLVTLSEMAFIQAYRLHASKLKVTTDITVDTMAWATPALAYAERHAGQITLPDELFGAG